VEVRPRDTALVRADDRGREQVLAANLAGVLIVTSPREPPFRAGLLDRYLVAASLGGLEARVVLNKVDQGVPDDVEAELALRDEVPVVRTSATEGSGIDALREVIASTEAPWTLVGHSGTGKTSLVAALLPGVDVGAIGHLSEYWGQGRHTTTGSRWFALASGGGIVDSPGIRTFAPGRLGAEDVRDYFPGIGPLPCKFRDCLHRPDEAGCVAPDRIAPPLLASYRRLLEEIERITVPRYPGR
ncbi:MAG: ribosome small subunit-dependent GTPase A, partial [Myxococcota bacterium]